MIFNLGPFQFYRVEKNGTLDISLRCMEDWPCGWEYGWRDDLRGADYPLIEFRIGKLKTLYVEVYRDGCELWFMGLWVIFSWNSEKWKIWKSKKRKK
jgi:hypothetical protein